MYACMHVIYVIYVYVCIYIYIYIHIHNYIQHNILIHIILLLCIITTIYDFPEAPALEDGERLLEGLDLRLARLDTYT